MGPLALGKREHSSLEMLSIWLFLPELAGLQQITAKQDKVHTPPLLGEAELRCTSPHRDSNNKYLEVFFPLSQTILQRCSPP